MISNSLKTIVGSLLIFTLTQAQPSAETTASLSQFYSRLQGTYWTGTFAASLSLSGSKKSNTPSSKPLERKVKAHPIEISFLTQQGDGNIGYTFKKDISDLKGIEKKGFNFLDPVPCSLPDGSQEPRIITLKQSDTQSVYAGKINLNDCKPRKKKPSKIAAELPIERLKLSEDNNSLHIFVKGVKGPATINIEYVLTRVEKSQLVLE